MVLMPTESDRARDRAGALPPDSGLAPWLGELRSLMAIGIPMGLTQLVQFSINTVDVLMNRRKPAAQFVKVTVTACVVFCSVRQLVPGSSR